MPGAECVCVDGRLGPRCRPRPSPLPAARSRSWTSPAIPTSRRWCSCTRGWGRSGCGEASRSDSRRRPAGGRSRSRGMATGSRTPRPSRGPSVHARGGARGPAGATHRSRARDPVLVGHSDGASIALIYAAHHPVARRRDRPARVRRGDVPRRDPASPRRLRRGRPARTDGTPPPGPRRRVLRLERRVARSGVPELEHQRRARADRCPLLLIQGERDQYGTMAQLDEIEQRATGHVRRVQLDCQHSPPTEMPGETVGSDRAVRGDSAPIASPRSRTTAPARPASSPTTWPRSARCIPDWTAGRPTAPNRQGCRAAGGPVAGGLRDGTPSAAPA